MTAIFVDDQTPPEWLSFIALNKDYFVGKDMDALKQATGDAPRQVGEPHT